MFLISIYFRHLSSVLAVYKQPFDANGCGLERMVVGVVVQ